MSLGYIILVCIGKKRKHLINIEDEGWGSIVFGVIVTIILLIWAATWKSSQGTKDDDDGPKW